MVVHVDDHEYNERPLKEPETKDQIPDNYNRPGLKLLLFTFKIEVSVAL